MAQLLVIPSKKKAITEKQNIKVVVRARFVFHIFFNLIEVIYCY